MSHLSPCLSLQLHWRLPATARMPHVCGGARQRPDREKSLPEPASPHDQPLRLQPHQAGGGLPHHDATLQAARRNGLMKMSCSVKCPTRTVHLMKTEFLTLLMLRLLSAKSTRMLRILKNNVTMSCWYSSDSAP